MSALLKGMEIDSWGHIVTAVFFLLFIAISWLTYCPQRRAELERASKIPLDDFPSKDEA